MPEENNQNERPVAAPEPAVFPWEMFCVAVLFDLIGLIPILNFFSEILAGLIIGLWQRFYNPKTDPIITFFVAKIIDAISLGFLPSNIGVVVYAFIKKKAAERVFGALQTTAGLNMANKMLKQ